MGVCACLRRTTELRVVSSFPRAVCAQERSPSRARSQGLRLTRAASARNPCLPVRSPRLARSMLRHAPSGGRRSCRSWGASPNGSAGSKPRAGRRSGDRLANFPAGKTLEASRPGERESEDRTATPGADDASNRAHGKEGENLEEEARKGSDQRRGQHLIEGTRSIFGTKPRSRWLAERASATADELRKPQRQGGSGGRRARGR